MLLIHQYLMFAGISQKVCLPTQHLSYLMGVFRTEKYIPIFRIFILQMKNLLNLI